MKTILFILLSTSFAFSQDTIMFKGYKPEMHPQTSKYKPGFVFYADGGVTKVTLIKWELVGRWKPPVTDLEKEEEKHFPTPESWKRDHYRWTALFERDGLSAKGYTDDSSIDIALGKILLWKGAYYEPIKSTHK